MEHFQLITIIGSFVAMLVGMWTIVEKLRADIQKSISLIFKRFDDHKDAVDKKLMWLAEINDSKYSRQDLCQQTRETFKDELSRINSKLDLLLQERREK